VESFNFFLESGLDLAVEEIPYREFRFGPRGRRVRLSISRASIGQPIKRDSSTDVRLMPAECRERGITYSAPLLITLSRALFVEDSSGTPVLEDSSEYQLHGGEVPIMVSSQRCHLAGMDARAKACAHEEASEFGGYFICNGIERIVRMLQMTRRNYPMAIARSSYTKRGKTYSNKAVVVRSVRADQSAVTVTLHYLVNGGANLRFALRRQEFFIPIVLLLRCLRETTDREIFHAVCGGPQGASKDPHLADRVQLLLKDSSRRVAGSRREASLAFLGSRFRDELDLPETVSDAEAGMQLIHRFILVHLSHATDTDTACHDKFVLLTLMLRKLYKFVGGDVLEDSADSLANQELLLAGHLYGMFVKEKLVETLQALEASMKREVLAGRAICEDLPIRSAASSTLDAYDMAFFRKCADRLPSVGRKVYYLLATGTLVSSTGLDLMQASGFTVVADKINFMRFLTHFRSVHRGQFFTEMKTTAVRKLLPEAWGFLCPVHTPDGAPCGLLNHLAAPTRVTSHPADTRNVVPLLTRLGMTPLLSGVVVPWDYLPVFVDGKVVGACRPSTAASIAARMRILKGIAATSGLPMALDEGEGELRADATGIAADGGAEILGRRLKPHAVHALRSRRKLRDRVCRVMASAVLGYSDVEQLGPAVQPQMRGPGTLPPIPPHVSVLRDESFRSVHTLSQSLPMSLEVAFIPPPAKEYLARDGGVPLACTEADRAKTSASAKLSLQLGDDDQHDEEDVITGPFPGLFISGEASRLIRVVRLLPGVYGREHEAAVGLSSSHSEPAHSGGCLEIIGPLEQQYLDIACSPRDFADVGGMVPGTLHDPTTSPYTHMELTPMSMLSLAASLTPFSDLNQSPRNMYQCQMGKQTMGTPLHAYPHRSDTKLYRIQTPQAPIVQNSLQSEYGMDQYPAGTNAVVAVIAYTGVDMEDAMIVNKSSYERGFGHASVYKTISVDLVKDTRGDSSKLVLRNRRLTADEVVAKAGQPQEVVEHPLEVQGLDEDGLPPLGKLVREGDPLYAVYDTTTGKTKVVRHKDAEPAFVEAVRAMGADTSKAGTLLQKASIRLRFNRNPVVGDKFSSRHGQKGVMSILWPQQDMPFTESGMTPDVIINPHAFPSRMTIGMLVESMAGKAGALHGRFHDATPFRFSEQHRAVDYFGEQLRASGYQYYGSEPMYSGTNGEPLMADIFIGVVYYQRLRHMVSDKSQVRSTGPINNLTRQPIKGRKKHGGIRFGEMERDSLIAHGTSFLLHDRLMNSSDRHVAIVCKHCGSILSPTSTLARGPQGGSALAHKARKADGILADTETAPATLGQAKGYTCISCGTGSGCVPMPMPYVFRYLANELAAMNIRITLDVEAIKQR
jgi:DNA-directed RNA polymerase beta subunit